MNSEPLEDVVINVLSGDTGEGTVNPSTLTFAAGNWNANQTIRVTGVNDDITDGNQDYIIQLTLFSSGSDYTGIDPVDVSAINTDMGETAGYTISAISGNTTEEAGTATFTARLNSEPLEDVVINVLSSDTGEGTVNPSTLTFNAGNWNTDQTVMLTGVDDDIVDGNQGYTIQLTLSSSGSDYTGIDPDNVSAVNTDMGETTGYIISAISGNTTEEGGTATFTVQLNKVPLEDVVINVLSSDTGEGTVNPSTLTFTSADWNDNRTVTVTGEDDIILDPDQGYTIQLTLSSSGSDYTGIDPDDVFVVNTNMGEPPQLPDTGQTTCYDAAGGVITCPTPDEAFAQDGSYPRNQQSYTDNGDTTITDNNTGLMWQVVSPRLVWTAAGAYCSGSSL
ncbi:MAG: DUF1566 domain-containing protein, partial [Bacteroidetes bacterium]|nr:DUF1566 domain-containing protein [Bacteroidota bacterium]